MPNVSWERLQVRSRFTESGRYPNLLLYLATGAGVTLSYLATAPALTAPAP